MPSARAKKRRDLEGSMLTVEEREAMEEAVRRGIPVPVPARLQVKQPTYRDKARAKQLPPNSKQYLTRLGQEGYLHHVNVVTSPGLHGKPAVLTPIQQVPIEYRRDFFIWFILCGRGFGKSWTGSSWINEGAKKATGEYMAVMGRDASDTRAYCIEGESGIQATAPNDFYPKYEPSKKLVTWPNGVKCQVFYAEEPEAVRGPNVFRAWADEPASYKDAAHGLKPTDGRVTAMDNLMLTLRKGDPQLLVTGTPKPHKLVKDLMNYRGAVLVRGGTKENKDNLAKKWLENMEEQYAGTRAGRQELDGEVLDDNPNALWQREWIDRDRVATPPPLERVVVGVDPQSIELSGGKTGIVAAGRWLHPIERRYHYYVLKDASIAGSPDTWATSAVFTFRTFMADCIVPEKNNGGDMVTSTIKHVDGDVPVSPVWASRGKITRAEPISRLYEQGRVHHVGNDFAELEDLMCTWQPGMPSPDVMDAAVWALTALIAVGEETGDDMDAYTSFWNTPDDEDVMDLLFDGNLRNG